MLKFPQNRLMLVVTSTFIFSLLLASPLVAAEPKLPEDLPEVSQAPFKTQVIKHGNLIAELMPLYTTAREDPSDIISGNSDYEGVAKLYLDLNTKPRSATVGCSGALISPTHILTAAHCVTNDKNGKLILLSGTAYFETIPGGVPIDASQTAVHPDWNYNLFTGNDVAVLTLSSPISLTPYQLDSSSDGDLGVVDKVGYGRSGNGTQGDILDWGTKRDGQNMYDALADIMLTELGVQGFVPGSVLQYDFDNGNPDNDAFGFYSNFDSYSLEDTGLGLNEVNSARGDSGGPTFNGAGEITGITSYGLRLSTISGASSDIDGDVNSTFGEFSGDTSVSKYYPWIDSVINGSAPPPIEEDSGGPPCSKKPERSDCNPNK